MSETKFGIDQIGNKTPSWANWVFRITAILTTVATFVISGDPGIPASLAVRFLVYMKALDMFVLGLSKLFGVNDPDAELLKQQRMADGPGGTDPDKPRPQKPS